MKRSFELEREAVVGVAKLMAAAARTSPKTRGTDNIKILFVNDGSDKMKLIQKMNDLSKSRNRPSMERDAVSIAGSPALLLIGVRSNPSGLDCGFCGYKTCAELKKTTGVCSFNSIDLGIAIASAATVASQFHIDNRIMHSMGRAALELKLLGKDVRQALGIPLSATGKNPFFDRK